jgi:hypothetical protein
MLPFDNFSLLHIPSDIVLPNGVALQSHPLWQNDADALLFVFPLYST